MKKDFDSWNIVKKNINIQSKTSYCHPREIWWCSLGVNIGFEQDGTGESFDRPVVVIKGFNERIFFGVVLTSKAKVGEYYFPLGKIEDKDASAILSQVRLIDTKRLVRKITTLDQRSFDGLKEALQRTLF